MRALRVVIFVGRAPQSTLSNPKTEYLANVAFGSTAEVRGTPEGHHENHGISFLTISALEKS